MKFTGSESNIVDIYESGSDGSQEEMTGFEVTLGEKCDKNFFNEKFF